MQRKVIFIIIVSMILLFALSMTTLAESVVVKAQTDKDQYKVGDTVTVKVTTEQNTGLHSLFFDLAYDGAVLRFDSLAQGSMVTGELRKKEFLYAASDPATSNARGSHVIVSYALQGAGVVSPRTGVLCEMKFRVIAPGNPNIRYQFTYNNTGVTDGAGAKLSDVLWKNSNGFTIGSGATGAFILITQPYEMQVIYEDKVEVDAVCSTGPDYYIKYENQTNRQATDLISAALADPPSKLISLNYGYNNIVANLYQRINGKDYIIATDTVRVFRPEDGQFIKIVSPKDHQLLNTDMVDVLVSSPYETVTVDGLPAQYLEPGANNHKIYRARLWLKKGFNTITAETTGPQNVKYKDTIQIYYQKDSSIFSFTLPRVGEYFKPVAGNYLRIEGEIDSPYRTGVSTADGAPARNTVTLKVIFKPTNQLKDTLILANDKPAVITESTGTTGARSQYKFYNSFEIPLEGLDGGEIEIIAYKNKEGNKWDDEIHRVVYLDDNRLWIDLVQPNVFSYDLLDTQQQIRNFNEATDPAMENTTVSEEGGMGLPYGQTVISKETALANVADIVEDKDGVLYALTNNRDTGQLSIYKKGTADSTWQCVLTRPQMYGYALCRTGNGILLGVSNLYTTQESGLYLLKDDKMVNIQFPVTIEHVQFIEERDGLVYFYGNYYGNLYYFNINTLSEGQSGLAVESLNQIPFPNNFNIKQFVLSSDCETAVLRVENGTQEDTIIFYNRTEAGYFPAVIPGPNGENPFNLTGQNVTLGEYTNGDYNAYLILKNNSVVTTIMEYKKGARRYFTFTSGTSQWLEATDATLYAAGFKDNAFMVIYRAGETFLLKKGQIFFNHFYADEESFPAIPELFSGRLFITSRNQFYLGAGSGLNNPLDARDFFWIYRTLNGQPGLISFNYVNDDIDGLSGFSFEIDPVWLLQEDSVKLQFTVKEKLPFVTWTTPYDPVVFQQPLQSLVQLLKTPENEFYTLHRQYDPLIEREVIQLEFKNIQERRYLGFSFQLAPTGNSSPELHNLKVYKKIRAKVCTTGGDRIVVPIQGYVYDRTVAEVMLNGTRIPLGQDGSFHYNYEINRSVKLIPIEISCVNSTGASAGLKFQVEVIDSQSGVGMVGYKLNKLDTSYQSFDQQALTTTLETLTLSGGYYGLEGAAVGYEIYEYEYKNGIESLALLKRGLFQTTRDDQIFQVLGINRNTLGSGYIAGYFQDQEIQLAPGRQQLRIYCENPGGLRTVFQVGGKYPDVSYTMPAENQKIIFDNLALLTPAPVVQNVPINYQVALEAYETEQILPDQSKLYVFKRTYELTGEIKSLYNFTNLIVKSFTPGLVFENGTAEQSVKVEAGNRFRIKVNVEIDGTVATKDFDVGVIPSIPSLSNLKTGVRFTITKSYKDTYFVPDFNRVHPDWWTAAERTSGRVPIQIKFNRKDLPIPGAWMTLVVNHSTSLTGYLDPLNATYYCLKDNQNQMVEISGLKYGRNRIQWILEYKDSSGGAFGGNSIVMSASNSGRAGMNDDVFDYLEEGSVTSTQIGFSPALTDRYYDRDTLPVLTIQKDKNTKVVVKLNGITVQEEQGAVENPPNITFPTEALQEGMNEVTVTYIEGPSGESVSKVFSFLYDSLKPVAAIASWTYTADEKTLNDLTATVTEANFKNACLYYGEDIISRYPEVTIISGNRYLLRWSMLGVYGIYPLPEKKVKVMVYDRSGKESVPVYLPLASDMQKPDEEIAREVSLSLPSYNGDPTFAHESNYKSQPFADHTKFAPRQFLPTESVFSQMGSDGDYLKGNIYYQKVTATDGLTLDSFGSAVAISNNYAIAGAPNDDDNGTDSGSAYIFERDASGIWKQKQKLLATESGSKVNDHFGYSVAISGDVAIVGAPDDDDKGDGSGSVYVFKRDVNGVWQQKQEITASDGAGASTFNPANPPNAIDPVAPISTRGDAFGFSVALSGNIAVIGAGFDDSSSHHDAGSVYIFEQDGSGVWRQKQKLTASDGGASYNSVTVRYHVGFPGSIAYFFEQTTSVSVFYCGDNFGFAVSISGNVVAIGARGDDSYTGSIYIFERNDSGVWSQRQKLTANDRLTADYFGNNVAISGNLTVVGAPKDDNDKGTDAGKVYIFERDGGGSWNQVGNLIANDGAASNQFGSKVAIAGNTILIGTPLDDEKASDAGAVYVYGKSLNTWNQQRKITGSDGVANDYFGCWVAISGNVGIIGVKNDDNKGADSGSVNFYNLKVSDQLCIPEDKKFLVFKVAKDPLFIREKDDITEKIFFESLGYKQSTTDPEIIEPVNLQKLTLDTTYTFEGYNHIYYIVKIQQLKNEFLEASQNNFPSGIAGPGYYIYDQGALRVRYDEPVAGLLRDVYVTGDLTPGNGNVISDILLYDPNYETSGSSTLHPSLNHSENEVTFTRTNSASVSTVNFWLRLEDEGLWESGYIEGLQKQFLEIRANDGTLLLNLDYKGQKLLMYDQDSQLYRPVGDLTTFMDPVKRWNMITLRISKDEPSIEILINDQTSMKFVDVTPETLTKILAVGTKFYFGPPQEIDYNTGFYSIAGAYYIDRYLSDSEIQRTYQLTDKNINTERNYTFPDGNSDFNNLLPGLRNLGEGSDYFTTAQNVDYQEDQTYGSLKASSRMLNFLKTVSDEPGKNYVIFGEAGACISFNLKVQGGENSFSLEPQGSNGRYYFGNMNGNYGLGKDRWYSIAGQVVALELQTNARLVLRINDREQSWKLRSGRFHFVYDNRDGLFPQQVKMYIETDGPITLGTDISLNQGNYIIKQTQERSAAKTSFPFDLAGTVHFWYKPLNANANGLVNYDAVLFDSELIKVWTELDENGDAVFRAGIKDESGLIAETRTIESNCKVRHSWQHLQVAYNFKDPANNVVYFYIDGKVAGSLEGFEFIPFGSLTGSAPGTDNVWIGCSQDGQQFAQGYLDKVVISKYYQVEKYRKTQPAVLSYNESLKSAELAFTPSQLVPDSCQYSLEALDWSYYSEGSGFPIDLTEKPAGRYRLTVNLVINGHRYQEMIFFNIDTRPKFVLKERTPIIFQNSNKDLRFQFGFDGSYRFETEQLQYIGLAARITYNNPAQSQTRYLVQDFLNQKPSQWLLGVDQNGTIDWTPANPDNAGLLEFIFPEVISNTGVQCAFKYFYFNTSFENPQKFDNLSGVDLVLQVPIAVLKEPIMIVKDQENYDYKLVVDVTNGAGGTADPIFRDIKIEYETIHTDTGTTKTGSCSLIHNGANSGQAELYFDDILSWNGTEPLYGAYTCKLKLKYQDIIYMETNPILLKWEPKLKTVAPSVVQSLEIEEFSLLHIDDQNSETPTASFYLKYLNNGLGNIQPKLEIITGDQVEREYKDLEALSVIQNARIFTKIGIPKGLFKARLTLNAEGFVRSREIEINNTVDKPELVLTNWVDALVRYNNVFFSWKGYYHNQFSDGIQYQYNLDNQGWTTPNNEWRSVRFYNLAEGYHTFQVRASYHDVSSDVRQVTFFVDINQPVFDPDKISVQKIYDTQGVFYAVNLSGATGAIQDIALNGLEVNGTSVSFQSNGVFNANNLLIKTDGTEEIRLTARDKVGNYTDYTIPVENPITEILFPKENQGVRYSPLTLIGSINKQINAGLNIYVADTFSSTTGDYSGWKKAKLNPDRTFFVEDLFVNPGTAEREISTKLRIASVFDSGKVFERDYEVQANEVLRPIEMKLSTHAVEGEGSDTEITINCQANVTNISSWSIDFDGDGVYDLIELTKNPASQAAKQHSWIHKYSSLGLISPRVRVITTGGDYFSTTETLIIHEKIREASFKLVENPIAITTVRMADESNRVFVLHRQDEQFLIDVYEVKRNDNYLSKKLYDINLSALGIQNPVKLKALNGADALFIAANNDALGAIYQLNANQFGNYEQTSVLNLDDEIADFTLQGARLVISMKNRNTLTEALLVNGMLDAQKVTSINVTLTNAIPLRERTGLGTDGANLFLADYYNQRVVQLSPAFGIIDQFGARGAGEAEFIWPGLIRFYQNRLFISDSGRHDIQVFDRSYNPICTLGYRDDPTYYNYVSSEFFTDIADFEVIAREEGNRLYYYALILSRSTGKLSMIRLPQWEELKVRVRNNKIVFVKDGEVFTAKPDGSDLQKILSSDSLPRIEGAIDYPALGPDGRRLAFTSRVRLYNGETGPGDIGNIYTYDNLYYVNLENRKLTRVDLGTLSGYELERPVFNSNGSKLVFSARPAQGKWKVYTYNFESGLVTKLFEADENARFPYFSPDDRYVVFTSDFGGDEEIQITSVENPSVRVAVTLNNCRDSFPVWSTVYPGEITNQDLQKIIKSKIAFVSERNTHKGVYCVYLAQESESSISIYDLKNKQVVGNNPDTAALEVTTPNLEGDYPCFTGDGRSLIFEYYDGRLDLLKKVNFETNLEALLQGQPKTYLDMELVLGATRPAGMKNMITNFKAELFNGNEVKLSWNRYTDNDIFYTVQYKVAGSNDLYQSYVLSQSGTVLTGLKMGMDYAVRVFIVENDTEVATSYWVKVKMPEVVARPSFTIDPGNPYLVRLHAWKPDPAENYKWRFSWVIENTEIQVQNSQDYLYEFGTSGTKTIFLKAYTEGQTATHVSEPMAVEIVSDIKPIIEHNLADTGGYIELSAEKSLGKKLNLASAQWIISGPGREPLTATGSKVIVQLDGFQNKINVSLTLQRIAVNSQSDVTQVHKSIDLDMKEVKPIITYETSEKNSRLIRFSGEYSQGNINWAGVRWTLYANGSVLHTADGVTTLDYLFPETNSETVYTIALTIPRRNDGKTATASQVITVAATPIEPKINYQILELKQGNEVVGAKLLLDCTESKGSGVDYTLARWAVPAAANYGDQALQVGPTAIYNLFGINDDMVVEVALTLSRKNGAEPATVTKLININRSKLPGGKLVVNKSVEESANGKILTLDVFKSTGPNIDWERTEWMIDGQINLRGPMVRKEIPASSKDVTVSFTCMLYRFGAATPVTVKDKVKIGKSIIRPVISANRLSGTQHRMYELSVLDTPGVNIDWERTDWYIYDGGQQAIQLRGSVVAHEFPFRSGQMGYPVLVEMYQKGESYPFVAYSTIDVEGDELLPIISTEVDNNQPNMITFKATDSRGSNISWDQAKWNFGDSKETQFGPVVTYEYPLNKKSAVYKVTLTLTRSNSNGFSENKTVTKEITIGPDKIKAVIKVTKQGDNLLLSADESQGKGLLLDRSIWLFNGEGDSETVSKTIQGGIIRRQTHNTSKTYTTNAGASVSASAGFNFNVWGNYVSLDVSANAGTNYQYQTTDSPVSWEKADYSDYKNENLSFSSQNSQVGTICRRYVGGKKNVIVTLFVFRMNADGGVEGESITVNINLANLGGGVYGK
ncbi:MAG TPA: cohesin domain-containing protein [Bacillota bacterium]|nr:cohesin domain-containing protein [Bacillota bacterium]